MGLAQIHDLGRALRLGIVKLAIEHEDAAPQHLAGRHGDRPGAALGGDAGVDRRRMVVVDTDANQAIIRRLPEKTRLDGGIALHRAMTVDMVRRQIGEHRDIRHQPRRQIDLVGRNFQHIDRARIGARQFEHGLADIAADLRIVAAGIENVTDQGRRRRFAVGAGDGNDGRPARLGAIGAYLAGEEFDIADDLDARLARGRDDRMRRGMGERHARAQHQCFELRPGPFGVRQDCGAGAHGRIAALGGIVPGDDAGTARRQRPHGGHARARQAENGHIFSREAAGGDHRTTSVSKSTGRSAPTPRR